MQHVMIPSIRISVPGLISACKAVISEASDDSNQALGMTVVGAAWGIGYIVGPAMSGALADPIGQYNITSKSGKEGWTREDGGREEGREGDGRTVGEGG